MAWRRRLTLLLPPFLWAAVIFVLSSVPDLRSDLAPVWDLILRKIAHAAEYGILALLIARIGLADGATLRWTVSVAGLAAVAYAATDELHQLAVTGRQGSLADVGVDVLGAALGLAGLVFVRQNGRPSALPVARRITASSVRRSPRKPSARRRRAGTRPSGRVRSAPSLRVR